MAELNDEYRLLAIDSTTPGESRHGVDSALVKWVSEQCAAAKAEGKKLIAIMHHNLVEHIVYVDILFPSAVVSVDSYDLANALADGGVKFIFTGELIFVDFICCFI